MEGRVLRLSEKNRIIEAFDQNTEAELIRFLEDQGILESANDLESRRFLSRSILPHLERILENERAPVKPELFWKSNSNPKNLRAAYALTHFLSRSFIVAAVWDELDQLGVVSRFLKGRKKIQAVDWGAAMGTGPMAFDSLSFDSLPVEWTLLEKERSIGKLGETWSRRNSNSKSQFFSHFIEFGSSQWLPRKFAKADLWLMNHILEQSELRPKDAATKLAQTAEKFLEKDGLIVILAPPHLEQSRWLLNFRKEILTQNRISLKVLTPCLGHQNCEALESPGDFCHEEVTWWRPPILQRIEKLASLDRKSLRFSYLVLAQTEDTHENWLRAIKPDPETERLVSPCKRLKGECEFYTCGQKGKSRMRTPLKKIEDPPFERGSILGESKSTPYPPGKKLEGYKLLKR